jgi:hypothetical protein
MAPKRGVGFVRDHMRLMSEWCFVPVARHQLSEPTDLGKRGGYNIRADFDR